MLSDSLRSLIEKELSGKIVSLRSVSGGSINQAARLEMSNTGSCFLKWNQTADPEMFRKEVQGLKLLAEAKSGLRIPEVILQGTTEEQTGFLILEHIAEGSSHANSAKDFGERLARLHGVHNERFGLDEDNFIGRLPQSNSWHDCWADFFIQERISPQ